jgi:hypothetical protein
MRPDCIEVTPPTFDDDLALTQRVKDFAIEQFIEQARVEALEVAVFPWTAWLDIGGLCADRCDPFPYSLGHELRSIVGDGLSDAVPEAIAARAAPDRGKPFLFAAASGFRAKAIEPQRSV